MSGLSCQLILNTWIVNVYLVYLLRFDKRQMCVRDLTNQMCVRDLTNQMCARDLTNQMCVRDLTNQMANNRGKKNTPIENIKK